MTALTPPPNELHFSAFIWPNGYHESAWRLVGHSQRWAQVYQRIKKHSGAKRAIVAVARKLMCVIDAMLKTMTPYKVISP